MINFGAVGRGFGAVMPLFGLVHLYCGVETRMLSEGVIDFCGESNFISHFIPRGFWNLLD